MIDKQKLKTLFSFLNLKKASNDKLLFIGILGAFFIFFIFLIFKYTNTFGGGDNFVHYRVSRYAFKYPHLFLNHWGKPLFTAFSAPFSYLGGYKGIQLFNIFCALSSAVFVYLIGKKLSLKGAHIAVFSLMSAPYFFLVSTTALTEVFCAFVVVFAIYLFVCKRYFWSAIVISFILFARTEGFIFIGGFACCFLFLKQFKVLPFLLTGFFIYSVIGWFYFDDFLWVINQNPYQGAKDIYNHGTWHHYITNSTRIFGPVLTCMSLLGFIVSFYYAIKKKIKWTLFFLFSSCAVLYFMGHSIAWWLGKGGALGLFRVIVVITPIMAIYTIFLMDFILSFFKSKQKENIVVMCLGFILMLQIINTEVYKFDAGQEEKVYDKMINYLNESGLSEKFIIYPNAYITFKMDLDPFSSETSKEWVYDRDLPSKKFNEGSIFIWDSHLGPNEGGVLEEELLNDKRLELLKTFYPDTPFKVLGGRYFEIRVYRIN